MILFKKLFMQNHKKIYLRIFMVLSFVLFQNLSSCKKENNRFVISGEVKNNNIKDLTIASGFISTDFYNYKIDNNKSFVIDNSFIIKGALSEPHAFRFITNTGEISGLFFLDNMKQSVSIDSFDMNQIPIINNSKSNKEYVEDFLPLISDLTVKDEKLKNKWNVSLPVLIQNEIIEKRAQIRNEKDNVLFNYIKSNPRSYVGMWVLAESFSIYGYKSIYESSYNSLSVELKKSYCGEKLGDKISISSISDINGFLPKAYLFDIKNNEQEVIFKGFTSKYTLVDFWATYCSPCIRDFPNILELYNKTNRNYFDVLAVSIDSEKDFIKWSDFVVQKNLPWTQFIDLNTDFSQELMIRSVPANFLVDSDGKILLKNFSVEDLKEFLETNR